MNKRATDASQRERIAFRAYYRCRISLHFVRSPDRRARGPQATPWILVVTSERLEPAGHLHTASGSHAQGGRLPNPFFVEYDLVKIRHAIGSASVLFIRFVRDQIINPCTTKKPKRAPLPLGLRCKRVQTTASETEPFKIADA